ncbi:transcription factor TFIIIB component B'' [Frieseomelitta varia]|uniref:transcription factor TFIIIB component B'' n=1 Tax=Frieseomelitta varia TaxID=561572 RepID=UPI001CB69734|nr:transcription factor TFIIIB component B'' [Frieseomelitta varia]XP_043507414.1 transcription factor TFIIIB component B'' [Frieseomelitta varia]
MKRARIKAMVTVPTRRKPTQDISITGVTNSVEHNEKNKDTSDGTCITSQQTLENVSEDVQIQENLDNTQKLIEVQEVEEQIQNEKLHVDDQCNENKDDSTKNSEKSTKEIIQSPEILNATQINFPIKSQNRSSFMKPIPKLDNNNRVRKNSIQGSGASTSESEDDSKKLPCAIANHTKNDLVQSTHNTKDTVTNNIKNNLITSKVGQKRRILVSESARKLAEARREFHLKHENKTPDRSKLTMYDLIYYNPVTNPMKKSKESAIPRKIIECQSEEVQEEEEEEDDPSSTMPVPQVKVGPNGQLIIDEQSLVIEQTNAKRNRKVLAKEAIIDDDNNGSGFYKKRQKSKEWSSRETLNFYKALNTIGTDFLLMQSLFPNRTRQEMKLKFKKEEKVNRHLVEKALAYHQEFDTEMLEKSLAAEKELLRIKETRKQQKTKTKNKKSRKRRSKLARSIGMYSETDSEEGGKEEEDDEEEKEEKKECYIPNDLDSTVYKENTHSNDKYEQALNKTNKRPRIEKKILTDDVESYNDVDSDTEVYYVRPTRSGRLPKIKKLQGPDINTLDNERLNYCSNDDELTMSSENNVTEKVTEDLIFDSINSEIHHIDPKTVIPNINDVEPGSFVILSKESLDEPGKSVLQVYMVSSDVHS